MEYKSIWEKDIREDKIDVLDKDIDVDILIIGGGMTGINTAYQFVNSKNRVCVVEANTVGSGISLRTTAKITYLQETIYSKLADNLSTKTSNLYYDSQKEAIKLIKNTIEDNNIDCDLDKVDSYIFTDKNKEIPKIKKEAEILKHFGADVKEADNLPVDVGGKYAIYINDSYVFNPTKYLMSLKSILKKKGISIYEKTKIISIKKSNNYYLCKTDKYTIKASKVIFACHYPFFLLPLFLPIKTHIQKSFLVACDCNKNKKISMINLSKPIKSIRFYKDYMIFLSSTYNSCDYFDYDKRENDLLKYLNSKDDIKYLWSNHDIMTSDSLPLIGRINNTNMYIATGYNTWGMTNSVIASKVIYDLIQDNSSKYESLFDPNRGINKLKLVNLPSDIYFNAKGYIMSKFNTSKWITYKTINGKKVGTYKDELGEHAVLVKCPHIGCQLIFNNLEHTWDCPCHGSRFDIDGKCITGPSKYDISFNENVV